MKKIAVLGGIVVLLIVVIKVGTLFMSPGQEAMKDQTTTEESSPMVTEPAVSESREPITIEIQNENGSEPSLEDFDPTESAAALPTKEESTAPTTSAAAHSATTAASSITPMEPKTMYAIKSVNVRKGGSTETDILGGLAPGKEVKVNGESGNGWYRISYNGGDGYVYKTYLSTNKADVVKETTAAKKPPKSTTAANKKPAKATTAAKKEPVKSTTAAPTAAPTAPTPGGAPANETIAPFPGN